MRLALIADGDIMSPLTNSGVARGLALALSEREDVEVVGLIDTSLAGWRKAMTAILTLRLSRSAWRAAYTKGLLSTNLRSRIAERELRHLTPAPDLCIQIRGNYRPLGRPYVVFIDNTITITQRSWEPWRLSRLEYRRRLRSDRKQFAEAEHVLTAGRHVAAEVVAAFDVPQNRVTAIGGGINFDGADLPTYAVGAEQRPIVLFVGSEFYRKGGDLLVAAFDEVRQAVPDAVLRIVGTSGQAVGPGVEEHGVVRDRAQLRSLYAEAAVFCHPARFEPYGLVVQEAMAFGLPCVVSDVGSLPDLVEHGVTGWVSSVGDVTALAQGLIRLLTDPEASGRMGRHARARMTDHTWEAVAERLLAAVNRPSRPKGLGDGGQR